MTARMGARPLVAHIRHDYARMLLPARPARRFRAPHWCCSDDAVALYHELGMDSWAEAAAGLPQPRRRSGP